MSADAIEQDRRVQWFRDAGFGMFVHWGLYSILGHGEWAKWREDIPTNEYARLADNFHARRFDARALARLAREGGAKYIVFGARHHDGFALWDSSVSNFTSIKSPAGKDFVAEFVQAARAEGMRAGIYYSPLDWSWSDLNGVTSEREPLGWQDFCTNGHKLYPQEWARFTRYVHEQVRELMTNYGPIDLLWYDGCWYQSAEDWRSRELNAMVRKLQPNIIINNRSGLPEDYDTPENEIAINLEPSARPFETCLCMNDSWGYIPGDQNYKTVFQCLHVLLRVRTAGGNLLLNTSPDAEGSMPDPAVNIFKQIGRWLSVNGSSVYGCGLAAMSQHGTGFFSQPGILTARPSENRIYYHILRWLGKDEHCVKLNAKILSARLLCDGSPVSFRQSGRMTYLQSLPAAAPDPLDTVVELSCEPNSARSHWEKTFV